LYLSQPLSASAVMINDQTAISVDWIPFAGLKESGNGIGGIPYSFDDMQVDKLIVMRSASL
jgi:acyl-CoA reductase-like NAD-dependent aldehyde dehydrogenase